MMRPDARRVTRQARPSGALFTCDRRARQINDEFEAEVAYDRTSSLAAAALCTLPPNRAPYVSKRGHARTSALSAGPDAVPIAAWAKVAASRMRGANARRQCAAYRAPTSRLAALPTNCARAEAASRCVQSI